MGKQMEIQWAALGLIAVACGTLFGLSAHAQVYYCPDVPASLGFGDTLEVVVPDSFTISDVKVLLSGNAHDTGVPPYQPAFIELHLGDGIDDVILYGNGDMVQLTDTFDAVVFTDDITKESGIGTDVTLSGEVSASHLADFVGHDTQTTWTLTSLCDEANITEFGLVFNDNTLPATNCSLSVPWFVDMAGTGQGIPAADCKITSIIYLHNNLTHQFHGIIEYFTQEGVSIGPDWPDNYFMLPASATVAFRPVADDPATVQGGQESDVARAIPNRPMGTEGGNDNKKNGSLVIRWGGEPTDVQGIIKDWQKKSESLVYSSSVLLPPGAEGTSE